MSKTPDDATGDDGSTREDGSPGADRARTEDGTPGVDRPTSEDGSTADSPVGGVGSSGEDGSLTDGPVGGVGTSGDRGPVDAGVERDPDAPGDRRAVGELAEVVSAGDLDFAEKVQRLLAIGRDRLGVADGLLTRIDDRTDELEVLWTTPDPTVIDAGERLPMESVYCRRTVASDGLVRVPDAPETGWADDPAHVEHGVACYLGGRVDVDGERYGTVCFVDETGRDRPFTEGECRFVELLVGWLGQELERRRREHRLERYETIVETVEDGIYALDDDCRVTFANEGLTDLTGYDREAILGAHASSLVPGEVDPGDVHAVAEAADRSVATTVETADGSRITVENTVAPFPTEDGERGWVGVARDVTDREGRRRRLRELQRVSRELARATNEAEVCDTAARAAADVLDVPRSALVRVEEEGLALVAANRELRRRLGEPAESPVESAEFTEAFAESARRVASTGDPVVVDDDRRAGLDLFPGTSAASTAVVPVGEFGVLACSATEPDGFPSWTVDLLGVLAANTDAALDRAHREERMREIRADLERSNAELEGFAYAASHDLREPLRMVTSYLDLLERRHGDALDEDAEELLAFATDGAERMKEMIRALLEYSRVETRGRDPVPTDLGEALEQATANLAVAIEESDARVEAGDLPTVLGDRHQLIQLFQNLIGNAVEYAGEGPPRVRITAERDGEDWRVAVADDGVGIDPGAADRAFDMFERLGARGETEGTGMGLAICERIVDRHGGEIGIDSTPGDGTTVWFTLPAVEEGPGTGPDTGR